MINEKNAKEYCSDDISLIENYNEAINSSEVWICHHRLGIDLGKGCDELIDMGLYFDRPASELQFLSRSEHIRLHNLYMSEERKDKIREGNRNRILSDDTHIRMSISQKGRTPWNKGKTGLKYGKRKKYKKYKWMTSTGEIVEMCKSPVTRLHPDWKLIE